MYLQIKYCCTILYVTAKYVKRHPYNIKYYYFNTYYEELEWNILVFWEITLPSLDSLQVCTVIFWVRPDSVSILSFSYFHLFLFLYCFLSPFLFPYCFPYSPSLPLPCVMLLSGSPRYKGWESKIKIGKGICVINTYTKWGTHGNRVCRKGESSVTVCPRFFVPKLYKRYRQLFDSNFFVWQLDIRFLCTRFIVVNRCKWEIPDNSRVLFHVGYIYISFKRSNKKDSNRD